MSNKITDLKIQKRNPNRVNVFLDGEFAFGLARIVGAWLKVGQEITATEIEHLMQKDGYQVCYQKALHFLSYRPRSTNELQKHLGKKDIPPETIANTIERLETNGLVNDLRFAEDWVENRSTFRPRGSFALRAELRQKGVDKSIIETVLQTIDEEELAYKAGSAKASKLRENDDQVFKRKLYGFLSRRGFRSDLVREIIQRILEERQVDPQKENKL